MSDTLALFDLDPPKPVWRPDPVKVRRRLTKLLAELTGQDENPWTEGVTLHFRSVVPSLAAHLPDEEEADWLAQFSAEMVRLDPEGGPMIGRS